MKSKYLRRLSYLVLGFLLVLNTGSLLAFQLNTIGDKSDDTVMIKGVITNEYTKKSLNGAKVILKSMEGDVIMHTYTNDYGKYSLTVEKEK